MGTLTIRNVEDQLKRRLRLRAAARNRSMEEEARQILRAALQEPVRSTPGLAARVRARFSGLGDIQLPVAQREPVREPPSWSGEAATSRPAGKRGPSPARRRRR